MNMEETRVEVNPAVEEETSEENTVITESPREHLKEQMRTVYTDAVAAATEAGKTVSKRLRDSSR